MTFLKDNKGELKVEKILLLSLVGVLMVWAITFIVLSMAKNPGQIGDSFGMVNALFSALAFSLLIYTSLLQTQELRLQREELRENRKQLESSAKAHNELVNLTKVINRDKVIPQFIIESFEETNNQIFITLKTLYGDITFKRIHSDIKKSHKGGFSWGSTNRSLEGLKREQSTIGPIRFHKIGTQGVNSAKILYSTGTERKYMQEIKNLDGRWTLDFPEELTNDSNIPFD